jgi:nucleoside-diphosphate-sugar epimerase
MVMRAIASWNNAVGEAFNTVSPGALNLRGYAEAMFRWFGHEPKLKYLPFEHWKTQQAPAEAEATWEHIARSPAHSIEKARKRLGYEPRYTSLNAVHEAVTWLMDNGQVERPR